MQHKVFFHLALFCWMRRGEFLALEWPDFDFKRKTVSITKSTALVKGKPLTKAPKNKTSVRTVAVPAPVIALVKDYQRQQYRYRMDIGSHWQGGNHLFIQDNGLQMCPSTPYAVFKGILRRHNETAEDPLPDIPLHGLRHPYVKPTTKKLFFTFQLL